MCIRDSLYTGLQRGYTIAANHVIFYGDKVRDMLYKQLESRNTNMNTTIRAMTPADKDSVMAVSYTHLDVYKRQGMQQSAGGGDNSQLFPGQGAGSLLRGQVVRIDIDLMTKPIAIISAAFRWMKTSACGSFPRA